MTTFNLCHWISSLRKNTFSMNPRCCPAERLPGMIICFSYSLHHKFHAIIKPLRKESLAVEHHLSGGGRPVSISPPI
jgi:hypothetical protein